MSSAATIAGSDRRYRLMPSALQATISLVRAEQREGQQRRHQDHDGRDLVDDLDAKDTCSS
jgi:hypothetical protein